MSSFLRRRATARWATAVLLACAWGCAKEVPQKDLRISRVYPACGPQGVATRVTVLGAGFTSGDTVLFGRTPGIALQAVSEKELRVIAPPHPVSSVPVTVVDPSGGRRTIINAYRYCDPRTFDPNGDCRVDASDIVYLNNFLDGGGPAAVLSGDANGDGVVDKHDIAYLIAYLYSNGPPPHGAAEAPQRSAVRSGK